MELLPSSPAEPAAYCYQDCGQSPQAKHERVYRREGVFSPSLLHAMFNELLSRWYVEDDPTIMQWMARWNDENPITD